MVGEWVFGCTCCWVRRVSWLVGELVDGWVGGRVGGWVVWCVGDGVGGRLRGWVCEGVGEWMSSLLCW